MDIDLDDAKNILQKNKIIFKETQTIRTIARVNSIAPSDIYKLIKNKIEASSEISNMGRKTLQDLSEMKKLNLNNAIKILKAKGLGDVTPASRMKHIADELEITPLETYKLIS